jgi:hypothetical protein
MQLCYTLPSHAEQVSRVNDQGEAVFCVKCARPRESGEFRCVGVTTAGHLCGCTVYDSTVPGSAVPTVPDIPPLFGQLGELLALPRGEVAILLGPRGAGKSGLALTAFRRYWVSSTEMNPPKILEYAARLGARRGLVGCTMLRADGDSDHVDLRVARPALGEPWPDLIVDAIQHGEVSPQRVLRQIYSYTRATGARAIAVSQVTRTGEARGGADLEHLCDALLEVTRQRVSVLKSRSGPERSAPHRRAGASPTVARYYAVETTRQGYAMRMHPGDLKWGAPFRAAERGNLDLLPPPPLALAAKRSTLYGGQWVDAPDWEARRDYAHALGVPFLTFDPPFLWSPPNVDPH